MSEASVETEAEPEPQTVDETGYGPEDVLGNPPPPAPDKARDDGRDEDDGEGSPDPA